MLPSLKLQRLAISFVIALAALTPSLPSRSDSQPTIRPHEDIRKILPFDYHGVTIEDGPLKRQLDEVCDYYLRIPNDDLLKGFRARAGKPAPGAELGGWYSGDVFHVFGQILSGLARLHAATGDPAYKAKAVALRKEWSACIEPDGFFFFSRKPNAPHYIYDKMVGGLVDLYLYCGDREALDSLRKITDWAEKNLGRKRPYGADPYEWYTLSENLYRAYLATGETRYRDFAKVWEYTEYWGMYAAKADIFGPRPSGNPVGGYHAYSHVNTLGGAGAAYRVTGEKRYLDTVINSYDFLQKNECYATGGYGPNESLLPRKPLDAAIETAHNTFETQCGTWAAFKLCKHLISLTGDARYGDWVERLAINGIGATIPMTPDGRVMYYSDYCLTGASKRNIDFGWSCCTGTRPMAVADYDDLIYFHDSSGLYVNLFSSSKVALKIGGAAVTVRQQTRFPEEDRTQLTVTSGSPVSFAIRLRAPGWLAGNPIVTVDGQLLSVKPDRGHWLTVHRLWRTGDRLVVTLPQKPRVERLNPDYPYPAAIVRGPVVMAVRDLTKDHNLALDPSFIAGTMVASAGEPLVFHAKDDPALLIRPFYQFREGEHYWMYLDPRPRTTRWGGNWNVADRFRFTNEVGATVEHDFVGTGVLWIGYRFDDAGKIEVRVDGKVVAIVDQYGPGRDLPFNWSTKDLPLGPHKIKLTLLAERNPASRDHYVNVGDFEEIK